MKYPRSTTFASLLAIFFMIAAPLQAATAEESLDDIIGGFEDSGPAPEIGDAVQATEKTGATASPISPEWLTIDGHLLVGASYNYSHKEPLPGKTDFRGLSRLKSTLHLELNADLTSGWKGMLSAAAFNDFAYDINGRDNYTQDVLDKHEKETEFREAWVAGTVGNFDIVAGRQIVVWGKSDNIRITDVLNPLDNREPGLVDIEDLRLPVAMLKIDYWFGDWSLQGVSMFEKRYNKLPAYGSEFYPAPIQMPDDDKGDKPEFALALKGIFSGYDVSFYTAKIYDDMFHAEGALPMISVKHSYLDMAGFAANAAYGNFLVKTEAARFDGLEYLYGGGDKKSRLDVLAGVEYKGITDQMVSVEFANRHLYGFTDSMKNMPDYAVEDEFQTALRYTADLLHSRLHLLALVLKYGTDGNGGGVQRFSVGYDLVDALLVTAGAVNYDSGGQAFFKNVGDNDRFFLEAKYSF